MMIVFTGLLGVTLSSGPGVAFADGGASSAQSADVASKLQELPAKAKRLNGTLSHDRDSHGAKERCSDPRGCKGDNGGMARPGASSTATDHPEKRGGMGSGAGMGAMMNPQPGAGMTGKMHASEASSAHEMAMPPGQRRSANTSGLFHVGETGFFLDYSEQLGLTKGQRSQLGRIREAAVLTMATTERKIDEAEQKLWALTAEAQPNLRQIQRKTNEIAQLSVERRLDFIRAIGRAARALTDEQRARLESQAGAVGTSSMGGSTHGAGGEAKEVAQDASDTADRKSGSTTQGVMAKGMEHGKGPQPPPGVGGMGTGMGQGKGMAAKSGGMGSEMSPSRGMDMMGRSPVFASSMPAMSLPSDLPGFPGASHLYHIGATGFFLDHPEHIDLTEKQTTELTRIKDEAESSMTRATYTIEQAEEELWALTAVDRPDPATLKTKVQEISKMYSARRLDFIRSVGAAAQVLTVEQRKSLVGELAPEDHPLDGSDAEESQ